MKQDLIDSVFLRMKQAAFFLCFFFFSALSHAQEIDKTLYKGYNTALVIYDHSSGETIKSDPLLAARRMPPCSTFKIYNTLIGLELGLIKEADVPWYRWDGVHRDIQGWNQDLTLREAFRASAVPVYQILAREIGAQRMKKFVEKINYGNNDLSSGVDVFWLPQKGRASIMISADEQANLLNKLLLGKLPFSEKSVAMLRDIMQVAKTDKGTLYGKTGSGSDGKDQIGWFVGFLEHGQKNYVFACNITGGEDPSGKAARAIVENFFRSQGIF